MSATAENLRLKVLAHSAEHFNVPVMKVVCAWCKSDQGLLVCEPAQAGQTSHGICPVCIASMPKEERA